jgi:hypothetical protein
MHCEIARAYLKGSWDEVAKSWDENTRFVVVTQLPIESDSVNAGRQGRTYFSGNAFGMARPMVIRGFPNS